MARRKKIGLPKVKPRITKAQQRILDKYKHIVEPMRAPDYRPSFGKGSRGPTAFNRIQKEISSLSESYGLNQKEINSARGLSRRLNNIMKLVKTDSKIAEIMEHRWKTSDAFEQFGYMDFKDLKQSDITKLVEMYVAESGIYNLPSLATPENKGSGGDMDWAWNS